MRWEIRKQDKDEVNRLAEEAGLSPVVAWILLNRGVTAADEAERFLNPRLEDIDPKVKMADVEKAAARVVGAVRAGERVGVHGDYDVDGITGAALLIGFFREVGLEVSWHIPHRQKEGYGMSPIGVEKVHAEGASLLVTVDCGISDFEAADRARELGMDLIIVDHHQVGERMPEALAVVNAQRPDCPFPYSHLSGVGAAFFFLAEVRRQLRESGVLPEENIPNLKRYLDLVALGTIADVVPLTGVNRVLVHFGLEEINRGRRPGMLQLRRVADRLNKDVSAGQVSFQLAPRINAAGRIDSGEPGLMLLVTDSEREAGTIADQLNELNYTRRLVEDRILAEAVSAIDSDPRALEEKALVAAGEDWHLGVIGIVASRLVEQYYRPACVISVREGRGKGSLRSVPGVDIYQALRACSEHLIQFGGHPMAAGITIEPEKISGFRAALAGAVHEQAPELRFEKTLTADLEWPLDRVNRQLALDLGRLAPFGVGNPEPKLVARGALVTWTRELRNNALIMGLQEKGVQVEALGFGMADMEIKKGDRLDVVYRPVLDSYMGEEKLKLMLKDARVL